MLLSCSLNTALQKRKEFLDPLKVFKYFNSGRDFFKLPEQKKFQLCDKDCSQHRKLAADQGKDYEKCANGYQSKGDKRICLKRCDCKCSPKNKEKLPINVGELSNIDYKDCLDNVELKKEGEGKWREEKINQVWENLHEAAHFIFEELVSDFHYLRANEENVLEADYSQYNDYHAIDMFSMNDRLTKGDPHRNRIFLLYSLVYCTLNPNQERGEFLEHFESHENYLEYLRDVNFADFVAIVPILRQFFSVHDTELSMGHEYFWQKSKSKSKSKGQGVDENLLDPNAPTKYHSLSSMKEIRKETEISDIKNDLENLAEFFLRRSFLEEALDTGYNVYTAVNVYHLSFDLHKEFQAFYDEDTEKGKDHDEENNEDNKKEEKKDNKSAHKNEEEKENQSTWQYITDFIRDTWLVEIFFGYKRNNEEAKQRLIKSCFEEAKMKGELESAIERASVCFIFQSLLYFGCFLLSTSQTCYEDAGLLGRGMKDLVCCVAMYFCYQYLTSMAISEFYTNSLTVLWSGEFVQKVLICLNVLINSFFSLSLVYSSALVMKSSGSFTDTILNAIAIFFVSELDDMLVTDLDAEALEERTVQALIGIMMNLSKKHDPGIAHHLEGEQNLIRFIGWYSFIFLLPYSYYTYFTFHDTMDDLDCD